MKWVPLCDGVCNGDGCGGLASRRLSYAGACVLGNPAGPGRNSCFAGAGIDCFRVGGVSSESIMDLISIAVVQCSCPNCSTLFRSPSTKSMVDPTCFNRSRFNSQFRPLLWPTVLLETLYDNISLEACGEGRRRPPSSTAVSTVQSPLQSAARDGLSYDCAQATSSHPRNQLTPSRR